MTRFKKISKQIEIFPIEVRGNNDANFVKIVQLDERYLQIEVGDCCVRTLNIKISAEALSNFLTQIYLRENKEFLEVVKGNMGWTAETNEKFFGDSCNLNYRNEKI